MCGHHNPLKLSEKWFIYKIIMFYLDYFDDQATCYLLYNVLIKKMNGLSEF